MAIPNRAQGIHVGTALGGREENPCIKQTGKDGVKVIIKVISGSDCGTDLVQLQLMIDGLKEEVTATEAAGHEARDPQQKKGQLSM